MIKGIGTDIIAISRISKSINKKGFKDHVFSKKEQAYCDSKTKIAESYAGKFAAKESFLKSLGIGILDGVPIKEIEVLTDNLGKPNIHLSQVIYEKFPYLKPCDFHLSISHTADTAVAFVIIEEKNENTRN